jgi:hypothetical protein
MLMSVAAAFTIPGNDRLKLARFVTRLLDKNVFRLDQSDNADRLQCDQRRMRLDFGETPQDGLSFAGADICADVCFWHQADIGSQQMSAFGCKADITQTYG